MEVNDENENQMKKIIYKGKEKKILIKNPDSPKYEFFIIKKNRYWKFDKYKGSEYCVFHKIEEKEDYLIGPYEPKHRFLKGKYKH